jgi:hypothetical protein
VGKLVCTVELDKVAGITVTVQNDDDSITQTVAMNGTSITLTVKGSDATSTITQTSTTVSVACNVFEVTAAETITMKSTKASTYQSDDTMTVKSAKDMTITSDKDISESGTNVSVTGNTKIALSGGGQSTVDLTSSAAKIASLEVDASGTSKVSVSGAQVEIKADATLNAESTGTATLKGSLTNVQGQLVNLG